MKRLPFLGLGLLAAFLLSASPPLLAHDSGSSGGSSDSGHGGSSGGGGGGHSGGSDSHGGGSGGGGHSGNSDHGGGGGHSSGSSGSPDHGGGWSHHDHGQSNPFHNGASSAGFASHGATGSNVHHGPNGSFFQSSHHWEMRNFNPVTGAMFHSAERTAVEDRFRSSHSSFGFRQPDHSRTADTSRSRPWDPRRDALFHGHRFHRFHDAWVLIDDGSDPADDFDPPPGPYQFTDSDFPSAPSDDEAIPDSIAIAVQARLARRGYYHGKIDGILGPESREAISAFQTATGLRVTGYVNMDLIEALKL